MLPESIKQQLLLHVRLPSASGAISQLIECARDSEVDLAKVAHAISRDPAVAANVLRLANSPLYAQRRKATNLRQAVVSLGLNTALAMALSATLWSSVSEGQQSDAHYPWIWRRAVLGGTAARNLGEAVGLREANDLFLAGLLQDIGVFALGQAIPALYSGAKIKLTDHASLQAYEHAQLGTDHAAVGSWLLSSWGLPERICGAIEHSHITNFHRSRSESEKFDLCIQLAGMIADCVMRQEDGQIAREAATLAERCFGLTRQQFAAVLQAMRTLLPEMQALFGAGAASAAISQATLEKARAALETLRVGSDSSVGAAPATITSRAHELDDPKQRDPITGVFNHEALTKLLEREFQYAVQNGWALSLLVVSADQLAAIWQAQGAAVHEAMLITVARFLFNATRDSDVVARYATDRFAIILPGAVNAGAQVVARRIASGAENIGMPDGMLGRMMLSIGLATLEADRAITTSHEFLTVAESRLGHKPASLN